MDLSLDGWLSTAIQIEWADSVQNRWRHCERRLEGLPDIAEQITSGVEMAPGHHHGAWIPAVEKVDELVEAAFLQTESRRWLVVPTASAPDTSPEMAS